LYRQFQATITNIVLCTALLMISAIFAPLPKTQKPAWWSAAVCWGWKRQTLCAISD